MSSIPVTIAPFDGLSVCLFCGSSDTAHPDYTVAARAFGAATAAQGWRLVSGGVGTLEEVIELLSWKRLDLHTKPVIFLNINGFWDTLFVLMKHTVDEGMTPRSFLDAWVVCDTVEAAIAAIRDAEHAPLLQHDHR